MPPELIAALVALIAALAGFLRYEVERRRQRDRLDDLARKLSADRRRGDRDRW